MAQRDKTLSLREQLLARPGSTLKTNPFGQELGLKRLLTVLLITPVLLDRGRPILGHQVKLGGHVAGDIDHGHPAHHQRGRLQSLARAERSGSNHVTADMKLTHIGGDEPQGQPT